MKISIILGRLTILSNHLPQVMRRHPLFFFFLIVFGLAWVYELIILVARSAGTNGHTGE